MRGTRERGRDKEKCRELEENIMYKQTESMVYSGGTPVTEREKQV